MRGKIGSVPMGYIRLNKKDSGDAKTPRESFFYGDFCMDCVMVYFPKGIRPGILHRYAARIRRPYPLKRKSRSAYQNAPKVDRLR